MTLLSCLNKVTQVQHKSFSLSNSGQRHRRKKMKFKWKIKKRKSGTHLFCAFNDLCCCCVTQWKSAFKVSTITWYQTRSSLISCLLRRKFKTHDQAKTIFFLKTLLLINKIPIKKELNQWINKFHFLLKRWPCKVQSSLWGRGQKHKKSCSRPMRFLNRQEGVQALQALHCNGGVTLFKSTLSNPLCLSTIFKKKRKKKRQRSYAPQFFLWLQRAS